MQVGYRWDEVGVPPAVEVEWFDCVTKAGWHSLEEAMKLEMPVCVSIGYLIAWGEKDLRMISTGLWDAGDLANCGDVTIIPAGLVRAVKGLIHAGV